ncbi:ABC transporter permease [Botrimarina sp.]|uniref:ABC transporter permease n=1 Tax=Botrimarina sp. TaxID=2795802 RepID=UPI0032F024C0
MTRGATTIGDLAFYSLLALAAAGYFLLVVLLLLADLSYTSWSDILRVVSSKEVRFAFGLSLTTATLAAALSVLVATPTGYLLSRCSARASGAPNAWRSKLVAVADAVFDIPIVAPPLVIGVSLLILFKHPPFSWLSDAVVYEAPAVVLAQFVVACAFAVRTMRAAFDQISDRQEKVALTLGASRSTAFWTVALPQARVGLLTAATISWSRALGEFGPILVFASATRMRTEVLPTTIYLELQAGDLGAALAVSLLMIGLAVGVLIATRLLIRPGAAAGLLVGPQLTRPAHAD